MRPSGAIFVALVLLMAMPVFAQEEWTEFVSREDGFRVDFPGQPKVQSTTFKSEYDYTLPARVYSAERAESATR